MAFWVKTEHLKNAEELAKNHEKKLCRTAIEPVGDRCGTAEDQIWISYHSIILRVYNCNNHNLCNGVEFNNLQLMLK